MKGFILHIYDFLSGRKWLAGIILAVVTGLCLVSASRLSFNEDITDFLPESQDVSGQEKMAVLFEGGTLQEKLDAMYEFDLQWDMPAAKMDFFRIDPDPSKIDSLSVPGYIDRVLEEDKTLLMAPNPFISNYVRQDPLRLSSSRPGVKFEDGYMFTPDGENGIIFFDSPYGGSESYRNAGLIDSLNVVKAAVQALHPAVHIYSTGGPEVAVENSGRIKKDSFLALAIAAILILIVLWLSYKRFQDVLWILISIAFGAVFALGAIALIRPSISIIILGIGCTVIGIAVNYPLHYVDHLKYRPGKREALSDQIEPLLTGNITTVGAFLGLLFMKAPALRDFGFIGAMMLLGTIVFVLFFLPLFVSEAKEPRNTIKLDLDRFINPGKKARRAIFCAFLALTLFFALQSGKVGFDTNLHNINYMTAEQEKGFAVLEGLNEMPGQAGPDGWALLNEKYPALSDSLIAAGLRHGFTAHAFQPFFDGLDRASLRETPRPSLVEALNRDFDTIGIICSVIVFLFLILSFRSFSLAVVAFLPLAVSWIWIEGIMGLTGLCFNIVNIILATFIFGMGDDYTIFITEGLVYEHKTGRKILHSFKNAVVLSALIMFIGIGVLAFAKHPAMRSLGLVTVIGMITVVVMACYIPPVLFRWATTKKGKPRRSPVTICSILKTVWICFVYGVVMALLIPSAYIFFLIGKDSEDKRLRFHKVIQAVSKAAIYTVPGARYTLINPHGEDFSKPAIYVCNHQSHLDVLAIMALTPRLAFTTNNWVWNFPLYRFILKKAEFYPAANGHFGNAQHVKNLLDRGYSIVIFPEGTRSLDGEILRFHRGAFLTAQENDVDVLPLCIKGFTDVLPKHDFFLRKGRLSMEVGERIKVPHDAEIRAFTRKMRHYYIDWYKK